MPAVLALPTSRLGTGHPTACTPREPHRHCPCPHPIPMLSCTCTLQPWRLEVLRDVCTAQASAKVRAALRPGVARKLPELLLVGGEDGAGEGRWPEGVAVGGLQCLGWLSAFQDGLGWVVSGVSCAASCQPQLH